MDRIGDHLVATGRIGADDLESALQRQHADGGYVGQHLVLSGALGRRDLYEALAAQWQTTTRDLIAQPPDPAVAALVEIDDIPELDWVPCERTADGTLVIATAARPTAELVEQVAERFPGGPVRFVACTHWDVYRATERAHRAQLLGRAGEERRVDPSAPRIGAGARIAVPAVLLLAVGLGTLVDPGITLAAAMVAAGVALLPSICLVAYAGARAPLLEARRALRRHLGRGEPRTLPGDDLALPVYSILVPVFGDLDAIAKVARMLEALDYPRSRLDVIVLLAEQDEETIRAAKTAAPPENVRLLVVPDGGPPTRARACNYGLSFARGKYVVVYDVDDRPEPQQLRRVVTDFEADAFEHLYRRSTRPRLASVQARVHGVFPARNVRARISAIEQAHWFGSLLPGLDGTGVAVPISDSSAHFNTRILRLLGAWDPAEVTEDGDLGFRAVAAGYRVAVLDSVTQHRSPVGLPSGARRWDAVTRDRLHAAWNQLRQPIALVGRAGPAGVIGLVGLVLGIPLGLLAYPLLLGLTLVAHAAATLDAFDVPTWVVPAGLATVTVALAVTVAASGVEATRRLGWRVGVFALLIPVAWLPESAATWRALLRYGVPHRPPTQPALAWWRDESRRAPRPATDDLG